MSIKIKASKKGALHKMLHVKMGDKIPKSKMMMAKKSKNPMERKRATFAINASKWKH